MAGVNLVLFRLTLTSIAQLRAMGDGEYRDWHSVVTADHGDVVTRTRRRWSILSVVLSIAIGLASSYLVWVIATYFLLPKTALEKEMSWSLVLHVTSILLTCSTGVASQAAIIFVPRSDTAADWAMRRLGRKQRSFAFTPSHLKYGEYLTREYVERLASQIEANQCLEEFFFTASPCGSVSLAPILKALATAGHLKVLVLNIGVDLTPGEIVALNQCIKGNRRLRALSLTFTAFVRHANSDVGAAIVEGLSHTSSLEYISVSGARWTSFSRQLCYLLGDMAHLRELHLLRSPSTSDVAEELLETVAYQCPDLRVLNVS